MSALRFNVFGRIFELRREADAWRAFAVGADGKRGPAGFEVPAFIDESELEQFLFDLFHESATPANGDVRRITPTHFRRHAPPDPTALPGQIEAARSQLDATSTRGDTKAIVDCAGTLVALLTAARAEAEAYEIGLDHLPAARANTTWEESAWLLHHLATAAQYAGHRSEANALFAEALDLCRRHGWRLLEQFVLHHRGRSHAEEGAFDAAQRCFVESRAIRVELNEQALVQSSDKALSDLAKLREAPGRR